MKAAYLVIIHIAVGISINQSCSKTVAKQAVDDRLVGNWQWIRTDGGIANHIHDTPASTGQEKTLNLNANNTYSITINNVISSQGSFTVQSKKCIHDGVTKPYLEFNHDPGMMVEVVDSTFLKLSDEANDGTDSQYHRAGVTEPG